VLPSIPRIATYHIIAEKAVWCITAKLAVDGSDGSIATVLAEQKFR